MIVCRRKERENNALIVIDARTTSEAHEVLRSVGLNPSDYLSPFTVIASVSRFVTPQGNSTVCWAREVKSDDLPNPYAEC